jgi:ribosomal protein S18 acetylase RimI-like enzyme
MTTTSKIFLRIAIVCFSLSAPHKQLTAHNESNILCHEVNIAPYTPANKQQVLDLVFQDPLLFFAGSSVIAQGIMTAEQFTSEAKQEMENIFLDPLHIKQLLIKDGEIIGFVSFMETKEIVWIICLAITNKYRNKGYGKYLLTTTLQTIKELWPAIAQVQLNVNAHNEVARKLYVSAGFKISPNQPPLFQFMKAIQYEKSY